MLVRRFYHRCSWSMGFLDRFHMVLHNRIASFCLVPRNFLTLQVFGSVCLWSPSDRFKFQSGRVLRNQVERPLSSRTFQLCLGPCQAPFSSSFPNLFSNLRSNLWSSLGNRLNWSPNISIGWNFLGLFLLLSPFLSFRFLRTNLRWLLYAATQSDLVYKDTRLNTSKLR